MFAVPVQIEQEPSVRSASREQRVETAVLPLLQVEAVHAVRQPEIVEARQLCNGLLQKDCPRCIELIVLGVYEQTLKIGQLQENLGDAFVVLDRPLEHRLDMLVEAVALE